MSFSAAFFGKLASALLVVSLWLSAMQGGQTAYEAAGSRSDTTTPVELSYLLADQQPATIARAATAEIAAEPDSDGGAPTSAGAAPLVRSFTSKALRSLPPARAPPLSTPLHNFKARAPPIA